MTTPSPAAKTLTALAANLPETPDQLTLAQWETLRQELTNLLGTPPQGKSRIGGAGSAPLPNPILPDRPENGFFFNPVDADEISEPDPRESEEKYRTILASIGDAVITTDPGGMVTYLNSIAEKLTGWSIDDAYGLPMEKVLRLIDDQNGQSMDSPVGEVLQTGLVSNLTNHTALVSKSGQVIPIEDSAAPIQSADGRCLGVVMVFHDVTEKRKREDELGRLNRTLKALSNSSLAMMRADVETAYLNEVCRIVTEDCGHALVWIGYAENDAGKTVRPVAYAGFEAGYLETLHLTWADSERGRGPTGTAIRTGQARMCRNMLIDPQFIPWRAEALKRGYASSIALPMNADGKPFGALTIYSRHADPFSQDEVDLLSELANDLAYGITAIRQRVARAAAEAALTESEVRYRSLFQAMTEGFALHEIVCDERGRPCDYRFLDVNPAFERLTGLNLAEINGKLKSEVPQLAGDDPLWTEKFGQVALTGKPAHFENYSPPLDATFEVFSYSHAPSQFAVIFMDVSERRRMEASLLQNAAQVEMQRHLIDQREQERLQIARDLHDGPMQELAAALFTLQCAIQDSTDETFCNTLEELRGSLQHQLQELRDYACELRPPTLSRFGLRTAIKSQVDTFRLKHPDIEVRYKLQTIDGHLPEQVQLGLFRIYQQAMNNVARHAHASLIEIRLKKSGGKAILEVQDNGTGFEVPKDWLELARHRHLGLVGMRERAEAVGGEIRITSTPSQGTLIWVRTSMD
jgi:PAS domain S-box-containing protein